MGFGAATNQVMIGAMHFGIRFWDAFSWAGQNAKNTRFPHIFCMLVSPGKCIPKMHFLGEMRKSNKQNQVTAKLADGPRIWGG